MNRELKFRAWYGTEMVYEGFHIAAPGHAWHWRDGLSSCKYPQSDTITHPVMQFTGMKDRNGKDIYESDIVRILYTDWPSNTNDAIPLDEYLKSISHIGVVQYTPAEFDILFTDGEYSGVGSIHCGTHGRIEVIGNIYETPELLK